MIERTFVDKIKEQVRGGAVTKRYDDPIEVEAWGGIDTHLLPASLEPRGVSAFHPQAFSWRGRRYQVERLLKYWREAGEGWDPERARDHECFRVEAEGGTYDLRLDRLAGREQPQWRLARVWD